MKIAKNDLEFSDLECGNRDVGRMKEEMDEQPGTISIHSFGWRMTCSILVEDKGKKGFWVTF